MAIRFETLNTTEVFPVETLAGVTTGSRDREQSTGQPPGP
jgi:hypothetical protein